LSFPFSVLAREAPLTENHKHCIGVWVNRLSSDLVGVRPRFVAFNNITHGNGICTPRNGQIDFPFSEKQSDVRLTDQAETVGAMYGLPKSPRVECGSIRALTPTSPSTPGKVDPRSPFTREPEFFPGDPRIRLPNHGLRVDTRFDLKAAFAVRNG